MATNEKKRDKSGELQDVPRAVAREDARRRRLADAAGSREDERLRDALGADRVTERLRDAALPDDVIEALRPPLSRQNLIRHVQC